MTVDYTLTLTGSAQPLSDLLPNLDPNTNKYLRLVWLQPDAANANPIYVGSDAGLTSSLYGLRLEAPVSTIPPAPFSLGELLDPTGVRLSDLYVLGTTGEKVHLLAVYYN